MGAFALRAIASKDRPAVLALVRERWGDETVVGHGEVTRPADLPGFLALEGDRIVGLATYRVVGDAAELVTIDSLAPDPGIGTALLDEVEREAGRSGSASVWLVTTNDNLPALRFYQMRGYRIVNVDPGAVDRARALKPAIPLLGHDGIPIRDEIMLANRLPPAGQKETE